MVTFMYLYSAVFGVEMLESSFGLGFVGTDAWRRLEHWGKGEGRSICKSDWR